MSESTGKAVFLSYASQDAEAAKRICEALRAAGVEVWFDQRELVGGDAWDQKIRGQVSAGALFVPVISANTQERQEGYFRLEWHLAEQRSLLIAKGRPFIVPVSIDATRERGALVPDAFTAVQWTRLPGGETSPAFVARVEKLLGGTVVEAGRPRPAQSDERVASPTNQATVGRRVPSAAWVAGIAVIAIGAGATFFATRKTESASPNAGAETRPPTPKPQTQDSRPSDQPIVDQKSVAVLPFENRSGDKEQEYFSDGLTEEVLGALRRERDLIVPGNTSCFSFKGKTFPPRKSPGRSTSPALSRAACSASAPVCASA